MSTNFALSLSFEGIELLHRVTGGWQLVGEADVQSDTLDADLAELRAKAAKLEPGGLRTKVVIPLDQLKYLAIDTTQTSMDDIHAALDGTTPYALDELVIDFEKRGGRTQIAAVARETLEEAEGFAKAHNFNPVCFVAIPEPFTFQSEIFFGPSTVADAILGAGTTIERDILPIMKVGTRVKSRLLIFDIPEDELPDSSLDFTNLPVPAAQAAPAASTSIETVAPVDIPAEPVQEATPDAVELAEIAPPTEEVVTEPDSTDAPVAEDVEDTVEPDLTEIEAEAEPEPEVAQTDTPDPVADAKPEGADETPTAEPEDTPQVAALDAPEPAQPADEPSEPAPAAAQGRSATGRRKSRLIVPTVRPAAPELSLPLAATPDPAPVADKPALSKAAPAASTALSDVHIDPIIAEYHTARPKYKRRARRRVVGSLTQVVPVAPTDAPSVEALTSAPASAPVAPTPPARPQPPAAPASSRKWLVGGAIAASVALLGLLAWSQWGGMSVEPTGTSTAQTPTVQTSELAREPEPVAEVLPDDTSPFLAPLSVLVDLAPLATEHGLPEPVPAADFTPPAPPFQVAFARADDLLNTPTSVPTQPVETAAATVGSPVLRGQVLSPDEAARIYAATGVWQRAPRVISTPGTTDADAVSWPAPLTAPALVAQPTVPETDTLEPELTFATPANPPPPDAEFTLDENGSIAATPDGALTPEGAVVFAGLPDLTVRSRPQLTQDDLDRMALLAPAPEDVVVVAGPPPTTPPLRPAALASRAAVDNAVAQAPTSGAVGLDALTQQTPDADAPPVTAALANDGSVLRPRARPITGVTPVALPSNPDITSVIAALAPEDTATPFIDITANAIAASRRPQIRPANFASVVASARAQIEAQRPAAAPTPAAVAAAPTPPAAAPPAPVQIPSTPAPGGVARAATQEDAISLRDINLIGVYGRPNARRALVRLPNGSFTRVEIGSQLDGGQVTAIGDNALNYVKRGRTYALQVPES